MKKRHSNCQIVKTKERENFTELQHAARTTHKHNHFNGKFEFETKFLRQTKCFAYFFLLLLLLLCLNFIYLIKMVNWKQNVHIEREWNYAVCAACVCQVSEANTPHDDDDERVRTKKNQMQSDEKKTTRMKEKKSKIPHESTYTRVWVLENAKPMSMPTASTPVNVRTRFVRTNAQCAYGLNSKRFIFFPLSRFYQSVCLCCGFYSFPHFTY